MNDELQNLENRLGERLQAHYEAEYGEIRPASELWQRLAPVLASVDADDEQTSVHGTRKDVASVNTRKNASFDPPPEERVVDFAPRSRGRLAIFAGLAATIVLAVGIIALVLLTTSRPESPAMPVPGGQPVITQSAKVPTPEGRPTMANAPTPLPLNTSVNVQFPQVKNLVEIMTVNPNPLLYYFLRSDIPVLLKSTQTKFYTMAPSSSKGRLDDLKNTMKSGGFTETVMFIGNPPSDRTESIREEAYHFQKGEQEFFVTMYALPQDLNKLSERLQLSDSEGVDPRLWQKFFADLKAAGGNNLVTISAGKGYASYYADIQQFESLKTGATNLKVQPGWTEVEIDPQAQYFYSRSMPAPVSDVRAAIFATDEDFQVAWKRADTALLAVGYKAELQNTSVVTNSVSVQGRYTKPGAPDIMVMTLQLTDKNRKSLFNLPGWGDWYREQGEKLVASKATAIQVLQGNDLFTIISSRPGSAPTAPPNPPSNANQPVTVAPAPTPAPSDEKRENP
jgi:hypothetical protein